MYKKGFYIEKEEGNNVFSYDLRKNKKLYIPALIEINNLSEIKLQDDESKIAFEDFDFEGKFSSNLGLKNFYRIKMPYLSYSMQPHSSYSIQPHPNPLLRGEGIEQEIFLFDNHNHAFYFWYLARKQGLIGDNNILVHIDEHADTRDNKKYISKDYSRDMQKVFEFTNFVLNVGDYIAPAVKEGLIGEVIQIRNQTNLDDYEKIKDNIGGSIILNLDLDFFHENLDYMDYEIKKKVILDVAKKAKIITVASSPFFINQKRAIKVFKDIFG